MMSEILLRTISRSAPGQVDAHAEGAPHRHQVAEQHEGHEDRQQREDRADLPPQQVPPDDVQVLHATRLRHEDALLEVQRPLRARRGVRVVRHHDDGLVVIAVQGLEQVQDLVARLAIEVAGRLVAQQQRRVGDDGARDADALLLAARELARIVVHPLAEPDDRERDRDALLPVGLAELGQQQRQLDVARRGQHRQQVVQLEDEADVPRPPRRQLAARQLVDAVARRPSIDPSVGVSSPPIRFSSVVLPEPDGPISAR